LEYDSPRGLDDCIDGFFGGIFRVVIGEIWGIK